MGNSKTCRGQCVRGPHKDAGEFSSKGGKKKRGIGEEIPYWGSLKIRKTEPADVPARLDREAWVAFHLVKGKKWMMRYKRRRRGGPMVKVKEWLSYYGRRGQRDLKKGGIKRASRGEKNTFKNGNSARVSWETSNEEYKAQNHFVLQRYKTGGEDLT